jgi:signal transduction histidine kinase
MLDQLVAALVEDTPDAHPSAATVSVITAPSQVLADKMLVERAVGNLLDNALRYGREPGHQAVVTVTVADGRVTVADRGPGVDPELTDEEMFARFTSARGSSGLGLSIVRWVAEAHGGSLSVYNADEGGAIFEFRLPPMNDA